MHDQHRQHHRRDLDRLNVQVDAVMCVILYSRSVGRSHGVARLVWNSLINHPEGRITIHAREMGTRYFLLIHAYTDSLAVSEAVIWAHCKKGCLHDARKDVNITHEFPIFEIFEMFLKMYRQIRITYRAQCKRARAHIGIVIPVHSHGRTRRPN